MGWLRNKDIHNSGCSRLTYVYVFDTFQSVCRSRERIIVGFTTTYASSAYHYWCCEFESRSGRGVHHYVIKFVSDLRQVGGFLRVLGFPPPIKLTATISLKYHQTNKHQSVWVFFITINAFIYRAELNKEVFALPEHVLRVNVWCFVNFQ